MHAYRDVQLSCYTWCSNMQHHTLYQYQKKYMLEVCMAYSICQTQPGGIQACTVESNT